VDTHSTDVKSPPRPPLIRASVRAYTVKVSHIPMAYLYWSECLFSMTLLPEPQPVAKSAHKMYSKGVKSVGHGKQHADLYTDLHQQYGDMFKQYADKHMAGGCVINV